jgi:putative ABC transport system substrate-binding protein
MNRRTVLAGLLSSPLWLRAAARRPRVVYVSPNVSKLTRSWYSDLGFVDERDVEIVAQPLSAATPADREAQAREILQARPSVVMVPGWESVFLFQRLTREVPLVFINFGGDPVGMGLVQSLRRPGGNMTGSAQNMMSMTAKLFEAVREMRPGGKRGGVMVVESSLTGRHMAQGREEIKRAGSLLGLDMAEVVVPNDPPLAAVRAALERARLDYLFVTDDLHSATVLPLLVAHVERARLPTIYISREVVRRGGLMSFTPDVAEGRKSAAEIAVRILRGESPATIPVHQTSRYHLAINRKTAGAMGLEVPAALLARADEVID